MTRIVLLENPAPDDPLFVRVMAVRRAGYRQRRPRAQVPEDEYESISTHVLVCDDRLSPLMVFRRTSARACAAAGLPFPLFPALALDRWPEHAAALADDLAASVREGRDASYLGLWTTDPALDCDRPLLHLVMGMMAVLLVGLVRDEGAGQLIGATLPSLGTDRLLARYGIHTMMHGGTALPPVPVPHMPGELAVMIHLEEFSEEALAEAEKGRAEWERRLVL